MDTGNETPIAIAATLPSNPNEPITITTPANPELIITVITPTTIPNSLLPARQWAHHGIYLHHTPQLDGTHEILLGHTHNLYLHTKRTLATNPTESTWTRTLFITYSTPEPEDAQHDTELAALHARSNPHDEYTTLARNLHATLTQNYPALHLPHDNSILRSTQAELFPLDDSLPPIGELPHTGTLTLDTTIIIRILHYLNALPEPHAQPVKPKQRPTQTPMTARTPELAIPEPFKPAVQYSASTPHHVTSPQQRHTSPTTIKDLLNAGLLQPGTTLHPTYRDNGGEEDINATILASGEILYHGTAYPTPSAAAIAARGIPHINGWEYWGTLTPTHLGGPHGTGGTLIHTIDPLTTLREHHDIQLLDNALTLFGVPRQT